METLRGYGLGAAVENRDATFEIHSDAMAPRMRKGQKFAIERFYYHLNPIERWHVIVVLLTHKETDLIPEKMVHSDESGKTREFAQPHFPYVKRVVALPGEIVKLTDSEILINNRPLEIPDDLIESYIRFPGSKGFRYGAQDYKVPRDSIFVLSDNTREGIDSRHIGAVPMRCVMGPVRI